MKGILVWMAVLLISVVSVYGGLFTPKAPPCLIINNNTNLTVNYIETNEGGYFAGDVIIDGNLVAVNITVLGSISNVTILDINITNDMIVNGDLFVYGNTTLTVLNVTDTIYADNFYYQNGDSLNDTYVNIVGDTMTGNLIIDTGANLSVSKYITHEGDDDTYFEFLPNYVRWIVGGKEFIRAYSTSNYLRLGYYDDVQVRIAKDAVWINETDKEVRFSGCIELDDKLLCSWDDVNVTNGADSLGNHTAYQNLNMTDYDIISANSIKGNNESGMEFKSEGGIKFWLYD